jgi:maltose alpha-D-glucosyltransferase/alpha-amylase
LRSPSAIWMGYAISMTASNTNPLALRICTALPQILPDFLTRQRWFGGKARTISSVEVPELIPIAAARWEAWVVLARVHYADRHEETYALPLIAARSDGGGLPGSEEGTPTLRLPRESGAAETILCDALWDKELPMVLIEAIYNGRRFWGSSGEILGLPTTVFRNAWNPKDSSPEPARMKAEQSNTSIRFGERFILKFYRRLEEGINPDSEIGELLTNKTSFENTPLFYGALDYQRPQAPPMTIGILQAFVPNQGDAWRYTLGVLDQYFERMASADGIVEPPALSWRSILECDVMMTPPEVPRLIGEYWESAGLLGRRTAQLHLALASDSKDPAFRPEPFSVTVQQAQYNSMRNLALQVMRTLEKRLPGLPSFVQSDAANVLKRMNELLARFESSAQQKVQAELIRIHGDYHLGQVLYTGSDFFIIDFEGEPARSLEERRAKHCPLRDVAGMLRSFHYAAYTALYKRFSEEGSKREGDRNLAAWASCWQKWVSARFLEEYLAVTAAGHFLPPAKEDVALLLRSYLLEKAVYEVGYELNNRPDWVRLPLAGILQLLERQD